MSASKRFISTVRFLPKIYSSPGSADVKAYVQHALTEHCKTSGLDALGAETAEVSGGAHAGGSVSSEPFHITFKVAKADGTYITTKNPHTNRYTISHHFYVASSNEDLKARATKWAGRKPSK